MKPQPPKPKVEDDDKKKREADRRQERAGRAPLHLWKDDI